MHSISLLFTLVFWDSIKHLCTGYNSGSKSQRFRFIYNKSYERSFECIQSEVKWWHQAITETSPVRPYVYALIQVHFLAWYILHVAVLRLYLCIIMVPHCISAYTIFLFPCAFIESFTVIIIILLKGFFMNFTRFSFLKFDNIQI